MWTLPDTLARRFPLVARPRPVCLPLPRRLHQLAELAGTAGETGDPGVASTVFNRAALIASDVGDSDAAAAMCRQHAAAYLHAAPLTAGAAIRALEPVVNLARLRLRGGRADDGRRDLLAVFDAVSTGMPVEAGGVAVPADLVADTADRDEVRAWLWRILLADGTRALTSAGRWAEALAHVEIHRGIGRRMLDGRQVAVLAALSRGRTGDADDLLVATVPEEAWETAVTGCLSGLCHRMSGRPWRHQIEDLATAYAEGPGREDLAVFDARLGLALLDIVGSAEDAVAGLVVARLHHRAMHTNDGHAAREALSHPSFRAGATRDQVRDCQAIVEACALGSGRLLPEVENLLAASLSASEEVIRRSVDLASGSPVWSRRPPPPWPSTSAGSASVTWDCSCSAHRARRDS
ncbi:hypothetical protein ACFRI7_05805 [Streptomyces sp. NPDC056716]|uniref:hypothetical protein n=1 Tax=unclassified Streptomyces TaxID=2593676 RepID=UPI0036C67FE1